MKILFISMLFLYIALTQCSISKLARSGTLGNRQLSSRCSDLLKDLPPECVQQARHIGSNGTVANFNITCSKTCGEPLYNAFRQCDDILAIAVDFSCSENSHGRLCGDILANEGLYVPPGCHPLTPHFCPSCRRHLLQELNEAWGCCYYTSLEITGGVELLDRCDIHTAGLCFGAFSGEVIRGPDSSDAIIIRAALGFLPMIAAAFMIALFV